MESCCVCGDGHLHVGAGCLVTAIGACGAERAVRRSIHVRAYPVHAGLPRGGFLIVDDFYYQRQWDVFERTMRMVLPDVKFFRLDASHPIFNDFFALKKLDGMHHPASTAAVAEYYAVYTDNDPGQRMLAVISFNNDIGDYMEWSGDGWYPVNLSNDAYKFATNFIVYGLTH